MRLLEITDPTQFTLRKFPAKEVPPYAILSHRWGHEDDEVSLRDLTDPTASKKPGWVKIHYCAMQARIDGLNYIWTDSCCIDRASSSELSEAINSMYRWYERSKVCYAYLSDVHSALGLKDVELRLKKNTPNRRESRAEALATSFAKSEYFLRGWTLQELLAPSHVKFYTSRWEECGTRVGLKLMVSAITGVHVCILESPALIPSRSIAERMSWASHRTTTYSEDLAYCLLGLFGVNMPLLYGEEERSFTRLQEEIIRTNADLSIFTWDEVIAAQKPDSRPDVNEDDTTKDASTEDHPFRGILANHPSQFGGYNPGEPPVVSPHPFSITNIGVHLRARLGWTFTGPRKAFYIKLEANRTSTHRMSFAVPVQSVYGIPGHYVRDVSRKIIRHAGYVEWEASVHEMFLYTSIESNIFDFAKKGALFEMNYATTVGTRWVTKPTVKKFPDTSLPPYLTEGSPFYTIVPEKVSDTDFRFGITLQFVHMATHLKIGHEQPIIAIVGGATVGKDSTQKPWCSIQPSADSRLLSKKFPKYIRSLNPPATSSDSRFFSWNIGRHWCVEEFQIPEPIREKSLADTHEELFYLAGLWTVPEPQPEPMLAYHASPSVLTPQAYSGKNALHRLGISAPSSPFSKHNTFEIRVQIKIKPKPNGEYSDWPRRYLLEIHTDCVAVP